ncbi:Putative olfactory receptor 4A4 [Lemmus lemmus]
MVGNVLIVITVTISNSLGSPMYFFLASLSFVDIIISDLFFGQNTIFFAFCMTQLFTEHFFGGSEVFLLLGMAYDRYVAICNPLHYLTIMKKWVCVVLLILSWIGGFFHSVIQLSTIYGLPFCGPNIIDHFMCDMYPLLKLVCIDTYIIVLLVMTNGGLICTIVFLLLLILCCHPVLSKEPWSGREVECSLHLRLSHHCSCLLFLFPVFSCMHGLLKLSPLIKC